MYPVKQTDIADCGAACVKSILHHYGLEVDLHGIKMQHPIKFGFYSFQDMSDILGSYNLEANGYTGNYELLLTLEKPVIAQVNVGLLPHFVVVEKILDSTIYYMDPAKGKNLAITNVRFMSIWTSKILVINRSQRTGDYMVKNRKSEMLVSILLNKRTSIVIVILTIVLTAIVVKFLFT